MTIKRGERFRSDSAVGLKGGVESEEMYTSTNNRAGICTLSPSPTNTDPAGYHTLYLGSQSWQATATELTFNSL